MPRIPLDRLTVINPDDDIDIARHHAACVCPECDPDFHYERLRDERIDRAS